MTSCRLPESTMVIVAHPDDEVLWFSSVLKAVDRVVIAFQSYAAEPGLGERRARAVAELPYQTVCLGLAEAGSYGLADWARPEMSPFGLSLVRAAEDSQAPLSYQANYHALYARLRSEIASASHVVTHNPWGEYGHEDHVQVFRVVETLCRETGATVWVSPYASRRSSALARHYLLRASSEALRLSIDPGFASGVADVYKRHGCWTWADDWSWDREEWFLQVPLPADFPGSSLEWSRLLRVPSTVEERLPPATI